MNNRLGVNLSSYIFRLAALSTVLAIVCGTIVRGDVAEEGGPKKGETKYKRPVLIRFQGEINPLSEQSFYRKLDAAKAYRADLIVVEIESPGGWVDSSLNLAERLRRIDWARTVAFIPVEAISGAAVMSLGCDDIVMAPDAHFGDAGEIFLDDHGAFQYVPEKKRSYLASRLRVLAEAKGRSPALAEAMCDMNLVVFHVRNKETGEEQFLSEQEIASLVNPDIWEKLRPVFGAREKHFFTVSGKEAAELKLAQALLSTREDVRNHYKLEADFLVLRHTGVDTTVTILNAPIVTGLLIVVGLIALYIEVSMPGTFVGGLIAGLCFSLFFWSRFLGGTAGWLELILFLAGLIFLAVELFVLPGFGIAGFTGILLVISSIVMASQSFIIPHTGRELNTTLTQFGIVLSSAVVFIVAAVLFSRYVGAIPVAKSLVLELPQTNDVSSVPASSDKRQLAQSMSNSGVVVGDQGIADSPLRPAGKVRFGDRYIDVISDGIFVDAGKPVRIVDISGNRIVVREIDTV